MPDRYIEKSFIYMLVLALLLHCGVFAIFYYLPPEKRAAEKEPLFVNLDDMPELNMQPEQRQNETVRTSNVRTRVFKETAPRGTAARDLARSSTKKAYKPEEGQRTKAAEPREAIAPGASVAGLLKPRSAESKPQTSQNKLLPSAKQLASIEEKYHRKFHDDVANGDTLFLNSDDIQFGSFLRRFEKAIYGVWHYPQAAAEQGIEGTTPVRITFNRDGEVVKVENLGSSGSAILDDEVIRTLKKVGAIGSLPRAYKKDNFNLVAFFHYVGGRGSLR